MTRRPVVNSFTLDSIAWRDSDQFGFLREELAPKLGLLVARRESTKAPFEFRVKHYSIPCFALESVDFGDPFQVQVTEKSMVTAKSDRISLHYRTAGTDLAAIFGNNTCIAGPQDLRITDFQQSFYVDLPRFQSMNLVMSHREVLGELPFGSDQNGDFIRDSSLSKTLRQLIPCVFQELRSASDLEAVQMLGHLRQLTIDTLRFHMIRDLDSVEIGNQSRLNVVLHYIEKHYSEQSLSPDKIAAATGMSRATLYRLCRKMIPPRELIQKTRLRKAAEVIRSGKGTNFEALSYSVGFSGRQSFTRAFQKEFELSPKEYRQEHLSRLQEARKQGKQMYCKRCCLIERV